MTCETKSIAELLFPDFLQTDLFSILTEYSASEGENWFLNHIADGDGIKNALWRLNRSPGLNIRSTASLATGSKVQMFGRREVKQQLRLVGFNPEQMESWCSCTSFIRPDLLSGCWSSGGGAGIWAAACQTGGLWLSRVQADRAQTTATPAAGDDRRLKTTLLKSLQTSLSLRWFSHYAKLNKLCCFALLLLLILFLLQINCFAVDFSEKCFFFFIVGFFLLFFIVTSMINVNFHQCFHLVRLGH